MEPGQAVAGGGTGAAAGIQRLRGLLQTGTLEPGRTLEGVVFRGKTVSEGKWRIVQPRTVRAGREAVLYCQPVAGPGSTGGLDGILFDGDGLGGKHAGPVDGTGGSRRVPGPLEYAAQGTGRTLPVRGLWRGGGRNAAFYALQRGLVRTVQQRGRTERRIQGGGDDTALPAQAPEGQYPAGLEFPPDV